MDANVKKRLLWNALGAGAGIVAAAGVRKLLTAGWRGATKSDPPGNPAAPANSWTSALVWSASLGAAVGVARLVAKRGAAEGWKRATGELPPGIDDTAA